MPSTALELRDDATGRADLQHCHNLLAAGSKSFSAASWLLPRRMRDDAAVFYAFCRVADDAVDDGGDPAQAVVDLTSRLDGMFGGDPNDCAVDRALTRVIRAHALPRAPFDALLDGFAWDARAQTYASMGDVLGYAARVASAVGVVMTYLMGVRDRQALARACDLGAAMQLTNICRDVGEDARRGRIYLPGKWLEEAGVDADQLLSAPAFSPELGEVVSRVLARADALYVRAAAGIDELPADCRPAIRAAGAIYGDIGRVIRTRNCDSVSGRARVGLPRKLWLLLRAWTGSEAPNREALDSPALSEVEFLLP